MSLLQYIQSHGFAAEQDGEAVVFFVPCTLNGQECIGLWERVLTLREARNALGY